MSTNPQAAFAALFDELAPTPQDLVGTAVDASVLESYRDVRASAHPDHIRGIHAPDYAARGLLAHALLLGWRERGEAAFLLERARQHMLDQLRSQQTPHPAVYQLAEALTRFCDAWRRQTGEDEY